MARRSGRQSLNTSVVTVNNTSVLHDEPDAIEYCEFVKRFGRPDLEEDCKVELIGCEEVIESITDRIETLLDDEPYKPDFALLTGPSGTGKTTVVRKLAQQYSKANGTRPKLSFFFLEASWILAKKFGDPETRLMLIFEEAISKAPSMIFIDEIDHICPDQRKSHNEATKRIFNTLKNSLKRINSTSARVLVIAATKRPESLDAEISESCYFGDEIIFTVPKRQDRFEALKSILVGMKNELNEEQIGQLADASHCYSYPDLRKLCIIARKACKKDNGVLTYSAFKLALGRFKPVAIKSVTTPCPPLRWEDIGGIEDVKKTLQRMVISPLKHKDELQEIGIVPNKGAILYGPPGCSKTMLARALATESGYNFIYVKGPELFTKWVGDSEAAVRRLYKNAREIAPCIIFIDEIDSLASARGENAGTTVGDKIVAQLLIELDGVEPLVNVYTIGATNRPNHVESALLRPGRLDPAIYIPLPSEQDRREIFKVHMRPLALNFGHLTADDVIGKLALRTAGYSGAEIANVCLVAGTLAFDERVKRIEPRHFEAALEQVVPRTIYEHLVAYEQFRKRTLHSGPKNGHQRNGSTIGRLMRSLSIKRKGK